MAVFNPKQRLSPRATLYSPPPSHTLNSRACAILVSPGSSRSITSPRATRSQRHFDLSLITRLYMGSHFVHWPTLENQAHAELELPHGLSACDLSKSTYSGGCGRSCGVGRIQVHHVEYIHCFASGLQTETFPDLECAEDCQIHIFVTRLIDEVARGVAVHWSPVHWSIPDESSVIKPAGGRPDRSPVQTVPADGIAN